MKLILNVDDIGQAIVDALVIRGCIENPTPDNRAKVILRCSSQGVITADVELGALHEMEADDGGS